MIPTWKNIGGLSLDLSQRATQAAGNEVQQALAGLQDMAAQQRQFNVKAEDAATQENLLKFQQAARNMSLGELDALGKAAPEVLMDRFGLNQKNIGQALDFANKQDNVVRDETIELDKYQETLRAQNERPLVAQAETLLAESLRTGDSRAFNEFMTQGEGNKISNKSNLLTEKFKAEREALNFEQSQEDRALNREVAKENRDYTREQRNILRSEREANIALGTTMQNVTSGLSTGNIPLSQALDEVNKVTKSSALLAKDPSIAVKAQADVLNAYANSQTPLTPEAKATMASVAARTNEARTIREQQKAAKLAEFDATKPSNTYDSFKKQYGEGSSYGKTIDAWITTNKDRLSDNWFFDGSQESKESAITVIDSINEKRIKNGKGKIPDFVVGAAIEATAVDFDGVNEIDETAFKNRLVNEIAAVEAEDGNRQNRAALIETMSEEDNEIYKELNNNLNKVTKSAIGNQQKFLQGLPQDRIEAADPLSIVNSTVKTISEAKLKEDERRLKEVNDRKDQQVQYLKERFKTAQETSSNKLSKTEEDLRKLAEEMNKNRTHLGSRTVGPRYQVAQQKGLTAKEREYLDTLLIKK